MRRARIRRTAALLGGTAVAALSLSGVAAANGPTFVAGNPDCADIQGSASWLELKKESPQGGANRFSNADLSVVATVSGLTFDWTASAGIDAVIVKGGPNANVYTYSEATSGTGLHAPVNPENGSFYGLSHISFCYDRGTPPPPPPTDPCKDNPGGTKPNGELCTPPTDPCVANPGGMKPNGEPCTPPRDVCAEDPNGTKPNGEPCTPPRDVCAEDPNGMKPNGEPCTPPTTTEDPCVANPGGMKPNGERCTSSVTPPAPPAPPVATTIPSLAPPISGGSLGQVGEIVPAGASIVRLKRCVSRPFSAVVRGRGIRRVTMFVNGRKVRTMAGGRRRYALRVSPSQARGGVIRIRARVEFVAGSGKRAKTLNMTALRCSLGATQQIRFTG